LISGAPHGFSRGMPRARIYRQGRPAGQSGKARADRWILEPEPAEAPRPDPLMGWVGSGDTARQVQLSFASREAAEAYAVREGLTVEVVPDPPRRLILQSYSENFR
jgi:hypothetical protein